MTTLYAKKISTVALALAGLLLAGCINVQSNMALYGNNQWSGVQAVQLSVEIAELMEQGGTQSSTSTQDGVTVTETTSMETDDIEQWLANAQQLAGAENMNVAFNESTGADGSKNYVLQASGRSLELLNQVFFQGEADISAADVNGQRQITIKYEAAKPSDETSESQQEMAAADQAMQEQMMKALGLGLTFRISGGEIVNSNATRVEGNTAIWENVDTVEVTLTEAEELLQDDIALVAPPADSRFSISALESLMVEIPNQTDGGEETTATTAKGSTVIATPVKKNVALPGSSMPAPGQESLVPFVLVGLVLVVLTGVVAVRVWQRK